MGITTNLFFVFVSICVLLYYIIPLKFRWTLLLVASYAYFIYANAGAVIFLAATTLITFFATLAMSNINETQTDRTVARKRAKRILIPALLLDLGILAVLKYTGFILININQIFGSSISIPQFILPLGISYYTFQSVGYIMDVFWNRQKAEKNLAKLALFVSFFPQMVQGPIGRYSTIGVQLSKGQRFDFENIKYGLSRIIWGLFKKMVIADWAAVYRTAIFNDPDTYAGIAIFGVLFYSAELYGDFSGGIDIVIGVARLFGIKMDENFNQPFFAVSVGNFWQRWHMSLGTWMKDYVFIPVSSSRWMKKFGKFTKKVFGKKTGRLIPVSLANIIVFLIVGIWHGADWGFIGWGLYNGIIIAASTLLAGVYLKARTALKISDDSKGWKIFMILRTFAIVNFSWYFDCADSFGKAFRMIGYSVTRFDLSLFMKIPAGNLGTSYTPYALITILAGAVILLIVGIIREKGIDPLDRLAKSAPVLQYVLMLLLLVSIAFFGPMAQARGFLYAQF